MNKNRMRGIATWGERADYREAPTTKVWRCRSGGDVSKMDVLTWGVLALCLKGQRRSLWSEGSAEVVVVARKPVKETEVFVADEGPNGRTG